MNNGIYVADALFSQAQLTRCMAAIARETNHACGIEIMPATKRYAAWVGNYVGHASGPWLALRQAVMAAEHPHVRCQTKAKP